MHFGIEQLNYESHFVSCCETEHSCFENLEHLPSYKDSPLILLKALYSSQTWMLLEQELLMSHFLLHHFIANMLQSDFQKLGINLSCFLLHKMTSCSLLSCEFYSLVVAKTLNSQARKLCCRKVFDSHLISSHSSLQTFEPDHLYGHGHYCS